MKHLFSALFCLSFVSCVPGTAQETAPQDSRTLKNPKYEGLAQNDFGQETSAQNKKWLAQENSAPVSETAKPLVAAARRRLDALVVYDGRYVGIDYPGGDVPSTMGVCTDVVIRSLRNAYGFDLQKAVHEDMKANFKLYPTNWGHTGPDKNIDHRRVPNLEVWFARAGHDLPITKEAADYLPGDIVAWRLDAGIGRGGPPHIGIISERLSRSGIPLVIHNIGGGPEESDMLFLHTITGHYRMTGDEFRL